MLSTLSATQRDLYFAVAAASASWRLNTVCGAGGGGESACCCESALAKKTPVASLFYTRLLSMHGALVII